MKNGGNMPENNTTATGNAGISYQNELRRKLIHLSSLWMVAAMCLIPRWPLALAFFIMLIFNLILERARACEIPVLTPLYDFFFGRMLRFKPERHHWIISGGPYVFASALLCVVLFPPPAAACAMAVMLLGDTAAALIGRKFGRHKTVNGKSWEGIAAFLVAGFLGSALVLYLSGAGAIFYLLSLIGVFPAAAVELFEKQLKIDDNFSIPLAMGTVLSLPLWF